MNNTLLPELQDLESKYSVWWSFKPNSSLKTYLEEQKYILPKYFSPTNLLNIVMDVLSNMSVTGNSDIIELDNDLQIVFDSWIIYVPNLMQEHLMPHIIEAPAEISQQLTDEHIMKNLVIESPYDILYKIHHLFSGLTQLLISLLANLLVTHILGQTCLIFLQISVQTTNTFLLAIVITL